jgi:TPR repeat protein
MKVLRPVLLLSFTVSLIAFRASRAEDIETIRKAADQGNIESEVAMAQAYFKGDGVTQDYHQAADWIRKAAEQGSPKAQYSRPFLQQGLRRGSGS